MSQAAPVQGSLAQRDVPELVHDLHVRRWSGTLILTHAGFAKSITVHEGRLVFASSTDPDERLGELLIRRGNLSYRQLTDAGSAVVPGKRLGAVLVERGYLEPEELVRAVVEHTREIIYSAFGWTEGTWRLREEGPDQESITLKMSTPDLILQGIRRVESWSRIERGVGGLTACYQRAEDYEQIVAQMELSFEQLSLLTGLNEPQDVEALCRDSSLTDFETCRTLWAYRIIGVVWRVDAPADSGEDEQAPEDEGLGYILDGE